jgi:tRNA pseudouridine38-40 synthase
MDCSLFASPSDPAFSRGSGSHCRYIKTASFHWEGDSRLTFEIGANAFLWKMVRSIVGSLLFYEERKLSIDEFSALLKEGNHAKAGPTAEAKGLCLTRVEY